MTLLFVPTETVRHPETQEALLLPTTAYCMEYMQYIYTTQGVDNCAGEVVTLAVARLYRGSNRITSFMVRDGD